MPTQVVTVWHLRIDALEKLRKPGRTPDEVDLQKVLLPNPAYNRFLYTSVGTPWFWTDRLEWCERQWKARIERPHAETLVAYRRGGPIGYMELFLPPGQEGEIEYLGLFPGFEGEGIGGFMLSEAIRRGFAAGCTSIGVNTCSLDHPRALESYQARGMSIYRTIHREQVVPPLPENPWPGATRTVAPPEEPSSDLQKDREHIVGGLVEALRRETWARVCWEGGGAAFQRIDAWSDLDLQVVVEDAHVEDTFALVEKLLADIAPVDLCHSVPQPTWHGHSQKLYRFEGLGPFLWLDLAVMKESSGDKFIQPELHGHAVVHFDKLGLFEAIVPLNLEEVRARAVEEILSQRDKMKLFSPLVLKSLYRGHVLEAQAFYQSFVVRPLVQALRTYHTPPRSKFHLRHAYHDLPPEIIQRLERLALPRDARNLLRCYDEALIWWDSLLQELEC